jgi:NADH-dependent peroxiredoxin subunit C
VININDTIPDLEFEVFHQNKFKKIKFSKFKGKWLILLFYPADFTFICPTELEEAAKLHNQFQEAGAEIISFSTDTVYVHKAWHDFSKTISKIKYPMAADSNGKICQTFGTYIYQDGLSQRATFIINPQGRVKSIEVHDNDIGRNIKETLRKFQAAKYVASHKGEVCPVNWVPESKTLKTGLNLVGKI